MRFATTKETYLVFKAWLSKDASLTDSKSSIGLVQRVDAFCFLEARFL